MKNKRTLAFCTILIFGVLSISARAQTDTRSVWTNGNGVNITDPQTGCTHLTFGGFNMATSWNEPTLSPNPGDAHFRGIAKAGGFGTPCLNTNYEFKLVASSATDNDSITGTWDVVRNGSLACSACTGVVTGLSQAAGSGNFYELYVDDPILGAATWLFSGDIDQRKDF